MLRPILSYLLVLIQLSSVSANTKLRLVYVPKRLLDSSMKDTFQTVSENVCGIIASRLEWAKLACFQKGSCDIYSNAFLPNSNADDVLNPIKCFTLVDKNACKLDNETIIEDGTFWIEFCDTEHSCEKGKMTKKTPPRTYEKTCRPDYVNDAVLGCIKYVAKPEFWCDARKMCLNEGADLFFMGNTDFTSLLKDFVNRQNQNSKDVWVGLHRTTSDKWEWTLGGTFIYAKEKLPPWGNYDPNGNKHWQCVRSMMDDLGKLGDRECNHADNNDGGDFPYICKIPTETDAEATLSFVGTT